MLTSQEWKEKKGAKSKRQKRETYCIVNKGIKCNYTVYTQYLGFYFRHKLNHCTLSER
jgi:hypothetical protein